MPRDLLKRKLIFQPSGFQVLSLGSGSVTVHILLTADSLIDLHCHFTLQGRLPHRVRIFQKFELRFIGVHVHVDFGHRLRLAVLLIFSWSGFRVFWATSKHAWLTGLTTTTTTTIKATMTWCNLRLVRRRPFANRFIQYSILANKPLSCAAWRPHQAGNPTKNGCCSTLRLHGVSWGVKTTCF